jgi:hypothetical protein
MAMPPKTSQSVQLWCTLRHVYLSRAWHPVCCDFGGEIKSLACERNEAFHETHRNAANVVADTASDDNGFLRRKPLDGLAGRTSRR